MGDEAYVGLNGADGEMAALRCEVEFLRRETRRLKAELRSTRQLTAETEERFRTMADTAPIMLWVADPDGHCTFVNRSWLAYTGRSLEAELGMGWQAGVHPDDLARCRTLYEEAVAQRIPFEMEYRLRGADGTYHLMLDRGVPRLTPDGECTGFIGAVVDEEESRRLVEELRRRSGELQRANLRLHELDRLKTAFMSTVSHELRTPLTSIQGFAEFLEDEVGGELSDMQRQFVANIMDGARRLRGLVDDLLDFTQLNAGTLTLVQQEIDLGPLVEEAVSEIRALADGKGLSLGLQVKRVPLVVWADAGRIRQVLLNLLNNAVKFTPEGGHIRVLACQRHGEATVVIKDSGIGIAPEHQVHLFEQFFQVDTSYTRTAGGAGLGLSLSRALVHAHGGHIGVKSQPGCGSSFWFTLPLSRRIVGRSSELRITIMPETEYTEISGDRP